MTALGGAGQESDGLEQSRSKFPFSGGGDEQYGFIWASQVALVVKNPPANAGDIRDAGSIPGSGRSPGGGHDTHSRVLVWRISWREEAGRLQSMGSQRFRHI